MDVGEVFGDADCVVVEPSSNRGFLRVAELRGLLDEAEQQHDADVVLELTDVRVLDGVAVAVIALAAERLREQGRLVLVRGLTARQQRKMRRHGLLRGEPRTRSYGRKRSADQTASAA
jgi:anti-anti-sigma regulatory factor